MKHIHSSGYHSATRTAIRTALIRYAKRRAAIITLTEYQSRVHRDTLREWAEEYGYAIAQGDGPAGDGVIAVRKDQYEILRVWFKQLTEHRSRRDGHGPPPTHSLTVLVRDVKTGRRILISLAHLTSHVEGNWGDTPVYYRVMVWRDANKHWRRHTRLLRRRYGVKIMMVADWNLNFERAVFRNVLRALYPGLRLTWRRFSGPGTHGNRFIDATITNMRIVEPARLIPDDPSSDHRPYEEELV